MITKGYVFDLGGVCTTHMNCSLVRRTVDKMGLNWNCISPNERTTLRSKYDNGKISLIEFYRRRFPGISDEDANTLVSIDLESYLQRNESTLQRMKDLKERGCKIAICSGMHKNVRDIFMKRFSDFFCLCDAIAISCDCGIKKPSKELLFYVSKMLKLQPSNITVVDDEKLCLDVAMECGFNVELFLPRK